MLREFLQRPQLEPLSDRDITKSRFNKTLITQDPYRDLVAKHFQQYPVLYVDLKDVFGATYEEMLTTFDEGISIQLLKRIDLFQDGIVGKKYIQFYWNFQQEPHKWRKVALQMLSEALQDAYKENVVVLLDEYDGPMHSAIEHGYATQASLFFQTVFGRLFKGNDAVCASMMVGICRTAKSGWLSGLNNVQVFPMHAEDDRYAQFFLFVEGEVELLCKAHKESNLGIPALREHYNGYTARGSSGPIKLFNPLSVVRALERNSICNF